MPRERLSAHDRLALRQLLSRYAFCLDGYDLEGYLATFLPDGVLVSGGIRYAGQAAIRAFLEERGQTPTRKHFIGLSSIAGDGQRCSLRTYYMLVSGEERSCSVASFGEYADQCVKVDNNWFFEERYIKLHFGRIFPLSGATGNSQTDAAVTSIEYAPNANPCGTGDSR